MRLPFLGPSKTSIRDHYERAVAPFSTNGEMAASPDQTTWAALVFAHNVILRRCTDGITLENDVRASTRLLGKALFQLITDGYILGRIENGTEALPLRFSALTTDQDYEVREFSVTTAGCTVAGVEEGVFSRRPSRAMAALFSEFSLDAAQTILDGVPEASANVRFLTGTCARAINLGREIALLENLYLNPERRSLVLAIRSRIQQERAMLFRLAQEGLAPADDVVDRTIRRVSDAIRGECS